MSRKQTSRFTLPEGIALIERPDVLSRDSLEHALEWLGLLQTQWKRELRRLNDAAKDPSR